jgi:hypothetical protein
LKQRLTKDPSLDIDLTDRVAAHPFNRPAIDSICAAICPCCFHSFYFFARVPLMILGHSICGHLATLLTAVILFRSAIDY